MPTAAPLLLTVTQAACALGVGRIKLYELIKDGSLQPVHIGRSVRFPMEALVLFVGRLRDEQLSAEADDASMELR